MLSREKWILDTVSCYIREIEEAPSCEEAEELIKQLKDFIYVQRELIAKEAKNE